LGYGTRASSEQAKKEQGMKTITEQTFYQGPNQAGMVLTEPTTVLRCHFIQVGYSLLRSLTQLEWPHSLLEVKTNGAEIRSCEFIVKGNGLAIE